MEATVRSDEIRQNLITREEAARMLGIKQTTLVAWAVKGWYDRELPVIRIHRGLIRYRCGDVLTFIAKRAGDAAR